MRSFLLIKKNGTSFFIPPNLVPFSVYFIDVSPDSILAVFESGKMLYQVESNLPLEEIETVIKNLKEDAE